MKPKATATNQFDLFRSHFQQILNLDHELCRLADAIDWPGLDIHFADCYSEDMGRPGNAIRLMVGLHYLKHAFDESDESVIARWVENPYWQYFCGFEYMQHDCPIHPTSMVKWRQGVGAEQLEKLLAETTAWPWNINRSRLNNWVKSLWTRPFRKKRLPFLRMPGFIPRCCCGW